MNLTTDFGYLNIGCNIYKFFYMWEKRTQKAYKMNVWNFHDPFQVKNNKMRDANSFALVCFEIKHDNLIFIWNFGTSQRVNVWSTLS